MLVPPSTTAGDNLPGMTANVSVAAAPAVMVVTVTTMVIVTALQLSGCRVDVARDNFEGRLRSSGQTVDDAARYTSSVPLQHRVRTRNKVLDTCRVILAPALRTALAATLRVSVGTPPHFGRQKRQCRRRLRRAPRPPRLTTLAPEPPTMPQTRASAKVSGASDDGTDNSPCATVCTRGRDCSTQTPWRLRPAGFAGVDSPIAFHEILVLLYALRRVIVTPERTGGAELAKAATAYDGLRFRRAIQRHGPTGASRIECMLLSYTRIIVAPRRQGCACRALTPGWAFSGRTAYDDVLRCVRGL